MDLCEQQPVGHHLHECVVTDLVREPDGVADHATDHRPDLLGDPIGVALALDQLRHDAASRNEVRHRDVGQAHHRPPDQVREETLPVHHDDRQARDRGLQTRRSRGDHARRTRREDFGKVPGVHVDVADIHPRHLRVEPIASHLGPGAALPDPLR